MSLRSLAIGALLLAACSDQGAEPEPRPAQSTSARAQGPKPEFVPVPAGVTGKTWIQSELARADRDGVKLVVYVGATWCEPCKAFHEALASGALDQKLAGVRFLDFDLESHAAALQDAECQSKLIPLFARPTTDGTCGAQRTEGGIKGSGAVDYMLPHLLGILR
ncbi:MAG: thioredoxin family protein [Polyangiaceae bacterium]